MFLSEGSPPLLSLVQLLVICPTGQLHLFSQGSSAVPLPTLIEFSLLFRQAHTYGTAPTLHLPVLASAVLKAWFLSLYAYSPFQQLPKLPDLGCLSLQTGQLL